MIAPRVRAAAMCQSLHYRVRMGHSIIWHWSQGRYIRPYDILIFANVPMLLMSGILFMPLLSFHDRR
ncbi:MAG: hypothetical protein ABI406_18825 [Ktedonobacteraceae bacterium]